LDSDGNITTDPTKMVEVEVDRVLHLESINPPANKNSDEITGTDGKIIVDGMEYATTDNKANVGGIIYTAMDVTVKTDSSGNVTRNPVNVTVTQDVDAIVDKVKSFVEDYNKILSSLYEKYDEKPESGYEPLTQAQKDAMKEEQITKWEEKAKKGLLYHDKTLDKIINEMREAINTPVDGIEGKYNSAYSIGISTKGIKGQLTLDEDKLRAALAEDSNAVYNVFAKLDKGEQVALKNADGTPMLDSDGKQMYKTVERSSYNGIAQRLGDIFTTAQKSIKTRAGSSADITEDSDLNTLLRNMQTKMSDFKKMMSALEEALYKKYDKLEEMLATLGTQMNFLFSDQ
ncbi:MAG: flagellar filament capping protein FliD, partial [Selenomonadaceae bacterium]|nr:flagellar filament capping protein FliD [Selenomonadaceae bacterium]